MTDFWSPEKRSEVMAKIRGITAPERTLRARLVQRGIRGFKVSTKIGNITPDLIFPYQKVAVFVDGCFWHKCPRCYIQPRTRVEYWKTKIATNVKRDRRQRRILENAGWRVVRVWECRLKKDPSRQIDRIIKFLSRKHPDKTVKSLQ